MRLFSLGSRLETAAEFIPQGALIADIGTDHCRLPIWLIMKGKIETAIASDIRALPLERGRENCRKWGVEDKISLRLGNGLEGIAPGECTHIIICGMGGDNISAILAAAPWTADGKHTLILQAETSAPDLRRWLYKNGYIIDDEKAVIDADRIFSVMRVTAGQSENVALVDEYVSKPLLCQGDEAAKRYIERVIRGIEREMQGVLQDSAEFAAKAELVKILREHNNA